MCYPLIPNSRQNHLDGAAMTRLPTSFALPFAAFFALAVAAGYTAADELFSKAAIDAIAADELFSRISNDSVFTTPAENSGASPVQRPQIERGQRILSIEKLRDSLRDAGLEPDNDENIVTINMQHARWTFTVKLGLTEDRDQLLLVMDLADLGSKQTLAADRLLALLGANAQHRPAFFSFSEKRKRIELLVSVENTEISPRVLREELRKLAAIAENTANLWEIGGSVAAATPQAPNTNTNTQQRVAATAPAQTAPQAAAAPPANLVGKWSAARSATEAFAMQLNADSSFVLVFVKDGKQNRSTGKFTASSGQLILTTAEGGKFGGGVANITARSFEFTPSGANASKLNFQRAS
jgi:hypothetical protein